MYLQPRSEKLEMMMILRARGNRLYLTFVELWNVPSLLHGTCLSGTG